MMFIPKDSDKYFIDITQHEVTLLRRIRMLLRDYSSIVSVDKDTKTFTWKKYWIFTRKNTKTIIRITVNEGLYVTDVLTGKNSIESVVEPMLMGEILEIKFIEGEENV